MQSFFLEFLIIMMAAFFWGRKKPAPKQEEEIVCMLSPNDPLTVSQVYSHVAITGATGSGKTSGPLNWINYGLLKLGMGHIWLCAKSDEAQRAINLARLAGREKDIIHVTPGGQYRCNIIQHLLNSPGGSVESTSMFMTELQEVADKQKQTSSDTFWPSASARTIKFSMQIIHMAGVPCGLKEIYEFIGSLPTKAAQLTDPEFQKRSFAMQCAIKADEKYAENYAFKIAWDWMSNEFCTLGEKTRSSILTYTYNLLTPMLSGPFADLISSDTTFIPEMAGEGKIIVIDCPVSTWNESGKLVQIAFKKIMQRAMLKRNPAEDNLGVALIQDESQFFLHDKDTEVQSISRQFKFITISAFQNLPIVYTAFSGGDTGRQFAQSWLSNHNTIINCANADEESNSYFSKAYGEERVTMYGGGGSGLSSYQYDPLAEFWGQPTPGANVSWSQQFRPAVEPSQFTTLLRGGHQNNCIVEAYVFQGGRVFSNGKTHMRTAFEQRF